MLSACPVHGLSASRCRDASDHTQLQRFALKYLVSERAAQALRRRCRAHG
jgi:hypothetical protein